MGILAENLLKSLDEIQASLGKQEQVSVTDNSLKPCDDCAYHCNGDCSGRMVR